MEMARGEETGAVVTRKSWLTLPAAKVRLSGKTAAAGIAGVGGTVAAALSLVRATVAPRSGAGSLSATVPVLAALPTTLLGLIVSVTRVLGVVAVASLE